MMFEALKVVKFKFIFYWVETPYISIKR